MAGVVPRTETATTKRGCLASFSEIVNYGLKRFTTDDKIATVNADSQNFKQGSLTATDYA